MRTEMKIGSATINALVNEPVNEPVFIVNSRNRIEKYPEGQKSILECHNLQYISSILC